MLTHGHIWSLLTLGRVHNLVRTRGVAGLVPLDVNRVDGLLTFNELADHILQSSIFLIIWFVRLLLPPPACRVSQDWFESERLDARCSYTAQLCLRVLKA